MTMTTTDTEHMLTAYRVKMTSGRYSLTYGINAESLDRAHDLAEETLAGIQPSPDGPYKVYSMDPVGYGEGEDVTLIGASKTNATRAPADYVQKNKKIIRGIDDRSAIALGRAIDISARALSMGLTRDRVVSIWRARGVGSVLSDALVPGVGR